MTHKLTPADVHALRLAQIAGAECAASRVAEAQAEGEWAYLRNRVAHFEAEAERQERRAERWKSGFVLLLFFAVTLLAACAGVIWRLTWSQ